MVCKGRVVLGKCLLRRKGARTPAARGLMRDVVFIRSERAKNQGGRTGAISVTGCPSLKMR